MNSTMCNFTFQKASEKFFGITVSSSDNLIIMDFTMDDFPVIYLVFCIIKGKFEMRYIRG